MNLRNIDLIPQQRCLVFLRNGEILKGKGDCICWLPSDEDEEIEDEVVRFILDSGDTRFFTNDEIKNVTLLY